MCFFKKGKTENLYQQKMPPVLKAAFYIKIYFFAK